MDIINSTWFNCENIKSKSSKNNFDIQTQEIIRNLPALNIINNYSLLEKTLKEAHLFMNNKKNFIVFGTGGSNLGARALVNILYNKKNEIFFFDNIDPNNFEKFLERFDLFNVAFIIISKSGSTPETLSQFSCLIEIFQQKNKLEYFFKNCLIITEDKLSPLKTIGINNNCTVLEHEKNIGGRYSVFSNVGIIPAIIAGFDVNLFYSGAKLVFDKILQKENDNHTFLAKIFTLKNSIKYTNNVIFTYSDSLFYFGKWYLQLWAESIGKENKGITPIHSIGTTDQHSQLQLYLAGPKDKFFSFITTNNSNAGVKMNKDVLRDTVLNYLAGKKMGDLMQAEQKATIESFKRNNFLFREIYLPKINEYTLGQLMCLSIIETIASCIYFEVNPFDQPAVEEGKRITKNFLS